MITDWQTCVYWPICGFLGGGGTWYASMIGYEFRTSSFGFDFHRGSGHGGLRCIGYGAGVDNDGEYDRGGGDGYGAGLRGSEGTGNGAGNGSGRA